MTQLLPGSSLGFLITDLSRLFRQAFDRVLQEAGVPLTPGEIQALAQIARHDNSRQIFLAEKMGVEPMTLSAYVDRLERRNMIVRKPDPTDRRAKLISLTPQARDVLDRICPCATEVFSRATRGLTPEMLKVLLGALSVMRANLVGEATSEPGYLDLAMAMPRDEHSPAI